MEIKYMYFTKKLIRLAVRLEEKKKSIINCVRTNNQYLYVILTYVPLKVHRCFVAPHRLRNENALREWEGSWGDALE